MVQAGSLAWDLDELPFDLGAGERVQMASEYSSTHGTGWSLAAGQSSQASLVWVGDPALRSASGDVGSGPCWVGCSTSQPQLLYL